METVLTFAALAVGIVLFNLWKHVSEINSDRKQRELTRRIRREQGLPEVLDSERDD